MNKEVKKYIKEFEIGLKRDIKKYKPKTKIEFRVYSFPEHIWNVVQAWWLYGRKSQTFPNGSKYRRLDMRIDNNKEAQQVCNYLKKKRYERRTNNR